MIIFNPQEKYNALEPTRRGLGLVEGENSNSILEPDGSSKEHRKNWARLIQKIYESDPLTCPKCSGKMKVISVTKNEEIIKKILKPLELWELKAKPLPRATVPPKLQEYKIDYSASQLPVPACA